jgi:hypothetical protein
MPVELLTELQTRPPEPTAPPEHIPRDKPKHEGSGHARTSPWLAFLLPLAVYLVAGALLAFHYESFHGDAQNRVANAFYVLFSRDPHLAAIGFVWNPLPSLAVLPLLPFKFIWPALTERAFAGNIVSALFMAGAVYQMHEIFRDLRVRWLVRAVLTGLFALHPMIVYYGGNGMSEASFLFGLLLAARYLSRWLAQRDLLSLAAAGGALGLAYLTRPEAIFAAFSATVLVLVVGTVRKGLGNGIALAVGFAAPWVFSVAVLAGISLVVTGHAFEQFSSVYGTASQVQVIEGLGSDALEAEPVSFVMRQVSALAPFLGVATGLALVMAAWRRDLRALAGLIVVGSVLAFAVASFLLGQTIGSTRYFISAVPLTVFLAGQLVAGGSQPTSDGFISFVGRKVAAYGLGAVAVVLVASGLPANATALQDSAIDPEDNSYLSYIFDPQRELGEAAAESEARFDTASGIARHLDGLGLGDGSILVDNFTTCVPFVLLISEDPKQFVITNDRDFEAALAAPGEFGVEYLLVPPPGGYGNLNALNRTYPGLYETGGSLATLAHEFEGPGCPRFRLYRVNGAP